jgi:SPOR domain
MWNDLSRHVARAGLRVGTAILALAALSLAMSRGADARSGANDGVTASLKAPPIEPALRGPPLDPSWPKHVYVITDSVMLGAKQAFIKSLPDWEVTYAGRPALMIRKALPEVRQQRALGPVAVVALGYNSIWEKDRHNFKRWSDQFDATVEEMLVSLKERGARKIVWVTLRELTPDLVPSSGVSASQYRRYAWYFPYVNERLRAIKDRHPEMALADWAGAAHQTGLTYDAIHLNPRGAELMTDVVKVAMGVGDSRPKPASIAATSPEPPPAPLAAEPPRSASSIRPAPASLPRASAQTTTPVEQDAPVIIRETRIAASGRASTAVERAPAVARDIRVGSIERVPPPLGPPPAAIVRAEPRDDPMTTASIPADRQASQRGNWIIQLGAFPEEEEAKERISEAQNLGKRLLANADPFTEKVIKGRQEFYRARFAGFDRDAAAAACSYFKRNDIDCITVLTAVR